MEKPIIKNPHFVDLEKTTVRMTLVQNGLESVAEFKVPPNRARGVNAYWDRILDEFDVERMRRQRNELETRRRADQRARETKQRASAEAAKLRELFDQKMKMFNLPFVAKATDAEKAAVRRAPDPLMLNIVVGAIATKYMADNNMSFIDLFDEVEDAQEAAAAAKTASSSQQPTM